MRIERFTTKFPNSNFTDYEIEFLKQSNWIESEYGTRALMDAMYAWDYARTDTNFRLETVLHIHYALMVNIDSSLAGQVREQPVWVGGCYKPFISTQLIKDELTYLFTKMEKEEIGPKEAHIQFEYIHPFLDGNGRLGRILYNVHRIRLGKQIHIIKESEKATYYEWFGNTPKASE